MVRYGIVGMGSIGCIHAEKLIQGAIPGGSLVGVATKHPDKLKEWVQKEWVQKHRDIPVFDTVDKLFPYIDALIIATPHSSHPELAMKAFQASKHVLVEKPAGVETKSVRQMNKEAEKSGRVFGIMYNLRMNPIYQKVRDLVQNGELGEVHRVTWMITDWYRSQAYYDGGSWRATWVGNGEITLFRNRVGQQAFSKENKNPFGRPEMWRCKVPVGEDRDGVTAILQNFAESILNGSSLTAPGNEGIKINSMVIVQDSAQLNLMYNKESR